MSTPNVLVLGSMIPYSPDYNWPKDLAGFHERGLVVLCSTTSLSELVQFPELADRPAEGVYAFATHIRRGTLDKRMAEIKDLFGRYKEVWVIGHGNTETPSGTSPQMALEITQTRQKVADGVQSWISWLQNKISVYPDVRLERLRCVLSEDVQREVEALSTQDIERQEGSIRGSREHGDDC